MLHMQTGKAPIHIKSHKQIFLKKNKEFLNYPFFRKQRILHTALNLQTIGKNSERKVCSSVLTTAVNFICHNSKCPVCVKEGAGQTEDSLLPYKERLHSSYQVRKALSPKFSLNFPKQIEQKVEIPKIFVKYFRLN